MVTQSSRCPAGRARAGATRPPFARLLAALALALALGAGALGACSREPDVAAVRAELAKPRLLAAKARGNYKAMMKEADALARLWDEDLEPYRIELVGERAGGKLRVHKASFDYLGPPKESPAQRKVPRPLRSKTILRVRVSIADGAIRSEMLSEGWAAGDEGKPLPKKARDAERALARIEDICEVCKRQTGEFLLEGMFVAREGEETRGAFGGAFPAAPLQPELAGKSIWRFLKTAPEATAGTIGGLARFGIVAVDEYVTIDAESGKKQ
jgi:hypothetical protein